MPDTMMTYSARVLDDQTQVLVLTKKDIFRLAEDLPDLAEAIKETTKML